MLTPVFDPGFVPVSYGFRPGKSAHDAVKVARLVIEQGYRWVVEVDLDAFFDRVNHDVLMARVARKVNDKRLLKLIRRYLEAGIMADGVRQAVSQGTHRGRRYRRCCRTSCSTISIRSSGRVGTGLSATPTISGSL
ncbi:reverse transcriptase domain-containing protein [Mycobacterium bourgelatii]|uniref:Reverse transcriptase domain-containing protein n=1 Tax=Mycobacterium bourgelatii TaxID=1273442 RepID=A0A7I9YPV6_MYCBU|nr:reverse transcriptase domain-containing protein [Mycobacterium bourgelatii]GFG90710.1 hypothetical protein MBOU_27520 [Mycobacterium bourgelatii]